MNKKLKILFEDNHLLIVNKLPGQLVQGDKTGDSSLLDFGKAYIKEKYNKPGKVFLGLCHRLDRPTSGIVIFARTSKALSRINKMFQLKQIDKTYWAIVNTLPEKPNGKLVDYLIKNEKQNKSKVVSASNTNAKKAILKYKLIQKLDRYYLLEIKLETGRHHQIRTQLAAQNMIIKGDVKYGARRPNKDKSIHLHARGVEFVHPVSKEILKIIAVPPEKDVIWKSLSV